LLTALNKNLGSLKFVMSFMIADMWWVKKQWSEDAKLSNRNFIQSSFNPVLSFILAKIWFNLGWTIHPIKQRCSLK